MTTDAFTELGQELDAESWDWLQTNATSVADALRKAIHRGASPEDVRVFVLNRCGVHRRELAQRCQAAARHLMGER